MRALLLMLLLLLHGLAVAAQDYAYSKIPKELLKDANAVVRRSEEYFTVLSPGRGISREKVAITILNAKAERLTVKMVGYDKLRKINSFSAVLYDANGKQIKKLKASEIIDRSAVSDGTLYDDNRVKIASFSNHKQYPFTVEFEYEVQTSNMMFYPRWLPQYAENLAVEKALLQVSMPAGLELRFKEKNLQNAVMIFQEKSNTLYRWEVAGLAGLEVEPWEGSIMERLPSVHTAPSVFEVEGYQGTMNTWKELGVWQNKLNAGRDVLPKATEEKLLRLVSNEQNKRDKVKKIYEYLQANTRYISVQVGIGGWQPFEASFVDSKGYGDCKALTNYTQAMLKAVGIPSYHADIWAGRGERARFSDFPSQQANHVVLCVPLEQDTVWLECTSQQNPFGYMGSFTDDRYAMLVTPEGGKLVRTPVYGLKDNQQMRRADIVLDRKGNAKVTATTLHTGIQQEEEWRVMHYPSKEDQKKWLREHTTIPDFQVESFEFSGSGDKIPTVTEKLELTVRQCASINGKRLFLKPNLMNQWKDIPPKVENRKSDVEVKIAFIDSDTLVYTLPEGFAVEFKPEDVVINSTFGQYAAGIKVAGQTLTYIRTWSLPEGRYPAASYPQFIDFLKSIAKADQMQVVLVSKEI